MALEMEGGFEVIGEAQNGAEALDMADDFRPDAIVLDLAMPVMDGLAAIPQIKQRAPGSKILVLSGFEAARMKREAMAAGADAYLEKGEAAHRIVSLLQELCPHATQQTSVPSHHRAAPVEVVLDNDVELERTSDALSSLAHELMTPVTVIQGFAETLVDRADDIAGDTVREWASTIARNAVQMAAIIRSFRETSRIDSGELELDLEEVHLQAIVEEVVRDLGSLITDRPVHVQGGGPTAVMADPVKVRQILTNLISNAVKFSPPGSAIEISVESGIYYGQVCVQDQGRGIPRAKRDQLFQKFARLGAVEGGTGLGLYISRRLARAHGGDVVCLDSDEGARFCLRLPLVG